MLIRELLADNKMNQLSEKERESLAFLNGMEQQNGGTPGRNRLSAVHELSADLLSPSDVSYDHTEEDLDVSYLRGGKTWTRFASKKVRRAFFRWFVFPSAYLAIVTHCCELSFCCVFFWLVLYSCTCNST